MFINKLKKLMVIALVAPSIAFADYQSELESMKIRDLVLAESALIVELKERADRTFQPTKISRFAATAGKRESDKRRLVESTLELIAAKVALNDRVEERSKNPSYNDKAAITIRDIKVTSDTSNDFTDAITKPTILYRGGLVKNNIFSDNVNFPLTYRVTYSENGYIRVQGVKINNGDTTNFTINYGDRQYQVTAKIESSESGWN